MIINKQIEIKNLSDLLTVINPKKIFIKLETAPEPIPYNELHFKMALDSLQCKIRKLPIFAIDGVDPFIEITPIYKVDLHNSYIYEHRDETKNWGENDDNSLVIIINFDQKVIMVQLPIGFSTMLYSEMENDLL